MTSMAKSKPLFGLHPNHLTYFRFAVAPLVPFLILASGKTMHLWAFILFILGALSDYLDGWIARKYSLTSESGKWLDPLADKLLVLGCLWAFSVESHIVSEWVFLLILIREVVVTFCRTAWMLEGSTLGAEKAGKWKLLAQTLLIAAAFAVLFASDQVFKNSSTVEHAADIGVSALSVIVLCLTWYSGLTFLINNRRQFKTVFFAKYMLAAGVGLIPKAPGTWGSALGVLLAAMLQFSGGTYLLGFGMIMCTAYYFYEKYKNEFGEDPSFFVLDEVCGIFVTFVITGVTWKTALPGFLLFRLFDIWKPFPIRYFEKWPGYWGIMADDIAAAVPAALILWQLPL